MGRRSNFGIDTVLETSLVTPRAGIPSLIEVFRQTGAAAEVDALVYVKARKRGLTASQMTESFLALWAAGGEHAEDFDRLRSDKALAMPIGQSCRPRRRRGISWPPSMKGGVPSPQDGTIEHAHDVFMNELADWALPSRKFGANAAWARRNVLLYNLLSTFKRVGLPEDLHDARPLRPRFLLLNSLGKVVRHAHETLLRFAEALSRTLADAPRPRFNLNRPSLAGV